MHRAHRLRPKLGFVFTASGYCWTHISSKQIPFCTEGTRKSSTTQQFFFKSTRPYLPSVAEVYDIHVGLLDVPVQILRAVLLLQVNGKGQLLVLPGGLQHSKRPLILWFEHYRSIWGQAFTEPLLTDSRPSRHSTLSPIFITHLRDADTPAAHTPHLIR